MNKPEPMTDAEIDRMLNENFGFKDQITFARAIIAARDAQWEQMLAEQEPVAWVVYDTNNNDIVWTDEGKKLKAEVPLYAAPKPAPKRCAQCKREYKCASSAGCPKCAPGVVVAESEFCKPLDDQPMQEPDAYCVTTPDGACVSTDPRCMHQPAQEPRPPVVVFSDHPDFVGGIKWSDLELEWIAKRDQQWIKHCASLIESQPAQESVCDKDPRGCWNVRCQLGKKCKNAQPTTTHTALLKQALEASQDATSPYAKQGAYKRMNAAIAAIKKALPK